MNFAQPLWLIGGVIACAALLWRYRRYDRQQSARLEQFIAPRLADQLTRSFSSRRRAVKRALFVAATACLFIALARPQAGFRWEETNRKGLEILFAVDTSKSMLAQDVKPSRLVRARLAVEDLLGRLNGDGVGLVAFAGNAFLQCPITLDYDAFRESLAALDTGVIPKGGTDIAAAIQEAQAAFKSRAGSDHILILLTDGEDLGGEGIAAARAAAKDGLKIFTVGVGSANGELVPVPTETGGTEFARDESGQFVKSRLDEPVLQQIAEATGGMYQPLGARSQGLNAIYEQGLAGFTRRDLATRQHKVALEQFHWPLLAALALLAAEMMIGTRRRAGQSSSLSPSSILNPGWNANRRGTIKPKTKAVSQFRDTRDVCPTMGAAALVLAMITLPIASNASPASAEKAYQKGDYQRAAQDYAASAQKKPEKPELQFNLGAAAYKSGEFAASEQAFESALKAENNPVLQSAHYNLGNARFRTGQQTVQANPQQTIKTWESAIASYDAALELKPDDADAQFNRDLVKRKMEELKKQQQQHQQQQQDQQDKQDEDQQQNQQDQQSQSDQKKSDENKQDPKQDQQAGKGSDQKKNQDQKDQQAKADQNQSGQDGKDSKQDQQQAGDKSGQDKQQDQQQQKQQAAKGSQPEQKKPSKGTPEANAKQDAQQGDAQADAAERRVPGQMTKEEARQLLDSLKGDERKVDAGQMARGAAPRDNDQPLRDW